MNLRTNSQKGFTIVELLIVIVVIAILAAISMVAYTGIQNNARTSTARSAAGTVRDSIEAFNAVHGRYPTTKTDLVDGKGSSDTEEAASKLPTSIAFANAAITAKPSKPDTVHVTAFSDSSKVVGYTITYWNYKTGAVSNSSETIAVGTTSGTGITGATVN